MLDSICSPEKRNEILYQWKTDEILIHVSGFLSEYSAHMMGCGVRTSRVVRSANRIGESLGYMVTISVIQKKKKRDRKASISIGYS